MGSGIRSAALAGFTALALSTVAGCSSSSRTVKTAKPPEPAPAKAEAAPSAAQQAATDHFYRGKALALAGDVNCARIEFDLALETFRLGVRPGEPADLAFAD